MRIFETKQKIFYGFGYDNLKKRVYKFIAKTHYVLLGIYFPNRFKAVVLYEEE